MTNMQEEYSKEHIEARAIAIKHIGISTYSSGKIYNYLINKGVSESIAHDVVEELIKRDYINDYRASRIILLQRNGYHQESKYYLYNRLLQGGVNEAIADSYINELDDDTITIKSLFEAQYNRLDDASRNDREFLIKTFLSLAKRRGYSNSLSSQALKTYLDKI